MPGGRGRLGTITQKCVPVETASKWPMRRFKATELRESGQPRITEHEPWSVLGKVASDDQKWTLG
jgi:hypothetical protein